jgi:hypothetical protein
MKTLSLIVRLMAGSQGQKVHLPNQRDLECESQNRQSRSSTGSERYSLIYKGECQGK